MMIHEVLKKIMELLLLFIKCYPSKVFIYVYIFNIHKMLV